MIIIIIYITTLPPVITVQWKMGSIKKMFFFVSKIGDFPLLFWRQGISGHINHIIIIPKPELRVFWGNTRY